MQIMKANIQISAAVWNHIDKHNAILAVRVCALEEIVDGLWLALERMAKLLATSSNSGSLFDVALMGPNQKLRPLPMSVSIDKAPTLWRSVYEDILTDVQRLNIDKKMQARAIWIKGQIAYKAETERKAKEQAEKKELERIKLYTRYEPFSR